MSITQSLIAYVLAAGLLTITPIGFGAKLALSSR